MNLENDWRNRPTITVQEAGKLLGLGRAAAYNAAGNGELPAIRIGRRYVVPVGALRRMLGETHNDNEPAGDGLVGKAGAGVAQQEG